MFARHNLYKFIVYENQMSRILPLLFVGGRLSVWYDSNHSIRRQVKGDTWHGHVLCARRYQVAAKRRNERAASMVARVTVKLSRRMCVSGEAKHKSRPNCKTNTRSWVKCRVRRDIDTRTRKSRVSSSFASFYRDMSYRNYAFYYWYSEIHFAFISRDIFLLYLLRILRKHRHFVFFFFTRILSSCVENW